jgi:hypothetical protein
MSGCTHHVPPASGQSSLFDYNIMTFPPMPFLVKQQSADFL